jgi:hypothetical protein
MFQNRVLPYDDHSWKNLLWMQENTDTLAIGLALFGLFTILLRFFLNNYARETFMAFFYSRIDYRDCYRISWKPGR